MMKLFLVIALALATSTMANEHSELKQFATGNNAFASDIYNEIVKEETGNFLFCPLSAEIILALTRMGARGKTAEQLSKALHIPETNEEIVKTFKHVIPALRGNEEYSLNSANKIYVQHDFLLNDQFKSTAHDVFNAEVENINFVPEQEAADKMNAWVEDKTEKKIKNLIDPILLSKLTRSVLINTLFFKGTWVNQFKVGNTQPRAFKVDQNTQALIDSMVITDYFRYYDSAELKATFLEIPYSGNDVTMTFVLPHEDYGLSTLENQIHDVFDTPKYKYERVHVQIPKFTQDSSFKLKKIMKKLGVEDLFEDYADLTNFGAPDQPSLKVSEIIQKTFIEIDEEGTTAAAATGVIANLATSILPRPPKPINFIADHPFIYYLSSPSGVMFVGRFVKS